MQVNQKHPIGKAPKDRQNIYSIGHQYHIFDNQGKRNPPYFQDYEVNLKRNHNHTFEVKLEFLSFCKFPGLFQYL